MAAAGAGSHPPQGYPPLPEIAGDGGLADAFRAFLPSAAAIADAAAAEPAARRAAAAALALASVDQASASAFFAAWFEARPVAETGFVTGYYEPELPASRRRTARFPVPLHRPPAAAAPLPDRASIEAGALDGLGLELVFLADPVEAFFVHVQGSARLRLDDGGVMRVGFAGRNGHPYTSIGRLAVERGLLSRDAADRDGLARWLRDHSADGLALMRENRSYIFFREIGGLAPEEGPVGSAGLPLTPGRSLAVDPAFIPLHTPVWVEAADLDLGECGSGFRRLMMAQDTGSAIIGPARGDIYVGTGVAAGSLAGRIRHSARMTLLVPRGVAA